MLEKISISITIESEPSRVWTALTDPISMSEWMGEPEMNLEVQTTWAINSPILISGFHHTRFENKGWILDYSKEQRLCYSHFSSVSKLPDKVENYSTIEFVLIPINSYTQLTIDISNFPTEIIYKHLAFYWQGTINKIKSHVEGLSY